MVFLIFIISLFTFGLQTALLLSLRLFNLMTVSFLFFQRISPEEVGDGLRKIGLPYEFSFILTTSMRYVPLIGKKARLIFDAQRSRGIDLRPKIKNIKNVISFLTPLLVQSFLLSEELALAMESRGFALKGRSFHKEYRISFREYGIMILSLISLVFFGLWEMG
jgi:energy-coupling factor transport system permease protein